MEIILILDIYRHLFNAADFTRRQVDLLQVSFQAVRSTLQTAEKGLA